MIIFLGGLLAIGLLVLIIYVLHRHQQKETIESVDRALPLPPLDRSSSTLLADAAPEDILGLEEAASFPEEDDASGQNIDAHPMTPPRIEPVAAPADWQAASRRCKEEGRFEEALATCAQAFPQSAAFRQAGIVLRAMIRDQRKSGDDAQDTLQRLYATSALASFFHSRRPSDNAPSSNALRRINVASWLNLPMSWHRMGYEHQDLLTTSDIRMMVQAWGEPSSHAHVRDIHPDAWQQLKAATHTA